MDASSWREEPIIPLLSLIQTEEALSEIERALKTFKCKINIDEQDFIQNKAIVFERENRARTYLVYDITYTKLLGYFTVAFKSIELNNISKNKRKVITAGESTEVYAAYLIGHVAKNCRFKDEITGKQLLEYSKNVIAEARDLVGGRIIYIDCKDNEKLKDFYEENGFKYFKTSEKTGLLQFYKKI